MSYRFDSRSEQQFKEDIRVSSVKETVLMQLYVRWLNQKYPDRKYTYAHNGINNNGDYIPNNSDIDSSADFLLVSPKNSPRKIEIKHCNPERPRFHIKINHINRCIKEDVCIVNWMGVDTDNPKFCILTPAILKEALETGYRTKMWQKPVIRFFCKDYEWHSL